MEIVYMAHSGLRYLVLAVGLIAVVYFLVALLGRKPLGGPGRALGGTFAGLLDLQVVLGFVLMGLSGYYPALIGHIVMMVMAAVLVHVLLIVNRRRPAPGNLLPLIGVSLALVMAAGGIMAIGRSVVGTVAL